MARIEIDSIISLFHKYEYPNIKPSYLISFIDEISDLFVDYLHDTDFHFGLESLRQLLKEAKKKNSLPFVMDEEDFTLIKDLSGFYLRPIYLFKNSTHILDNEDLIAELLSGYKILDGSQVINNYSFVDSKSSQLTQSSDISVGLIGKLHTYLNTTTRNKIHTDFSQLSSLQSENIDLLMNLIDKSHDKNIGFLHATDSYEEMSKIKAIRASRTEPYA